MQVLHSLLHYYRTALFAEYELSFVLYTYCVSVANRDFPMKSVFTGKVDSLYWNLYRGVGSMYVCMSSSAIRKRNACRIRTRKVRGIKPEYGLWDEDKCSNLSFSILRRGMFVRETRQLLYFTVRSTALTRISSNCLILLKSLANYIRLIRYC